MCDHYLPDYAYKEQHINCYNCSNTANMFMVDLFIDSNYRQARELSLMKFKTTENEVTIDAKGNKQILTKVVGSYTPWFAENPSQIPILMPICNDCKQNQASDRKYIHCHYGFIIFKMQKDRFNTGSPYRPWISGVSTIHNNV